MTTDTYIIGDVHGQYDKLARLLKDAGLVNDSLSWSGGKAALWFLGDFCDRGPGGIAVLDLVMRLQQEAQEAGSQVQALLGNHEPVILSAIWMGDKPTAGPGGNFYADWIYNGGVESDLDRLEEKHIEWMISLPALARVGDWLLMHANSMYYLKFGTSIEDVNREWTALLRRKDPIQWDQMMGEFGRDFGPGKPGTTEKVDLVLRTFGAKGLIHGHTCISDITHQEPSQVTQALVYENGRCVNVDAGLYYPGSPGFIYRLPDAPPG